MNRSMRIEQLRELEVISYRLCYCLLKCDAQAHEAAKELLLRVFRDERFFTAATENTAKRLRREAADICGRFTEQLIGSEAAVASACEQTPPSRR